MTDTRTAEVRPLPYASKNWVYVPNSTLYCDVDGNPTNLFEDYDYIILDEAQFFRNDVIEQLKLLLAEDKYIIIAGLDKDYRGEPFSKLMQWAMCVSDDVTKLTAICAKCGAPSTMAKLVSSDPTEILEGNIIIEDEDHQFVPVCRKCMYERSE
jgi:thymidine kinase